MSKTSAARDERMAFRLDRKTKLLVAQAARVRGLSLTEFCLSTLEAEARRTVEREHLLELSEIDRRRVYDLLMNPPSPTAALETAVAKSRAVLRR